MKAFLKVVRIVAAFIIATAVSGTFCLLMLVAAAENADRDERTSAVQYTCGAAGNYAQCYQQETRKSLISISGGGISYDMHLVIGSIITACLFVVLFIAIGFPAIRNKAIKVMG